MMDETPHDASGYTVTPEAQRELDRWSRKALEDLLLKARLQADQRASTTVTRKDVALAAQYAFLNFDDEFIAIRRSTLRRVLLFVVAGVVASLAWLLNSVIPKDNPWLSTAIGISLGLVSGAFGYFIGSKVDDPGFIRSGVRSSVYSRDEVLSAWLEIERALREVSAEKAGTDTASRPVGALIEDFYASNDVGDDFKKELSRLLGERNAIAHKGGSGLSSEKAHDFVARAQKIQRRISGRAASA